MPEHILLEAAGEEQDGPVTIEVEGAAPATEKFELDEFALNLAPQMAAHPDGKNWMRKFGNDVIDRAEQALSNSEEFRERCAKDWTLATGFIPPKDFPFKDAANAHVPLLLENLSRLVFRVKGEIFEGDQIFTAKPIGPDDERLAEILTLHGNWQLRNRIPDFERQLGDRGLLIYYFQGDVTAHSYYSPSLRQNRHEVLTVDDFIAPYVHVTTQPDYSDLPWLIKVQRKTADELRQEGQDYFELDQALSGDASWNDEPEDKMADAAAEVMGIRKPDDDKRAPHKIYWYEGWEKLPGQQMPRWVKALIHVRTHRVLHLAFHDEEDMEDRQRYEQQMMEAEAYAADQERYQAEEGELMEMETGLDQALGTDRIGPEAALSVRMEMDQKRQQLMPAMPEPEWMEEPGQMPRPVRMVPTRLFSHGVCIEPLVGRMGIGYGRILADHNRAADTVLSQVTDSGTLANAWSLILADGLEFEGGLRLGPMQVNKIKGYDGDDLNKKLIQLKPSEPSATLLEILKLSTENAQKNVQAPEVLSGQPGKSGETAQGITLRYEQAVTQISVSGKTYLNSFFAQVLKNNAKLNAIFLPDDEIPRLLNHLSAWEGNDQLLSLGRELYDRPYEIELRPDMRFTTKGQRIAEADELLGLVVQYAQTIMQVPPGAQALVYQAFKNTFEARGRKDLVQMLGPPPEPPQTPFGIQPQPVAPPGAPPGAAPPPEQQQPPQEQQVA